jgi:hypothetical protein
VPRAGAPTPQRSRQSVRSARFAVDSHRVRPMHRDVPPLMVPRCRRRMP